MTADAVDDIESAHYPPLRRYAPLSSRQGCGEGGYGPGEGGREVGLGWDGMGWDGMGWDG